MTPILSIVIATKNRVPYCINTVKTILNFQESNFELIIQDNSDNEELGEFLISNIFDERLIYNYTPPPFSSIDNFNKALELSSGEYVILIGDDDGVNSEIFDLVRLMKYTGLESLGSSAIAEYYWPGATDMHKTGNLSIPNYSGEVIHYNPSKKLIPLLLTGIVNYIPFNLPRIYHGIIKKDVMEKIREITGNYFGGLSPDIYSSIGLSLLINKHTLINYPFSIAGTCKDSTSAASVNGEHNGTLDSAPHFRSRTGYIWDPIIPRYYSIQTIWAETGIKVLRDFKREDLIKKFNLEMLIAQSLLHNHKIRNTIVQEANECIKRNRIYYLKFWMKVYLIIFLLKARLLVVKLSNFLRKKEQKISIDNILNIEEATGILELQLKEKNISPIQSLTHN